MAGPRYEYELLVLILAQHKIKPYYEMEPRG